MLKPIRKSNEEFRKFIKFILKLFKDNNSVEEKLLNEAQCISEELFEFVNQVTSKKTEGTKSKNFKLIIRQIAPSNATDTLKQLYEDLVSSISNFPVTTTTPVNQKYVPSKITGIKTTSISKEVQVNLINDEHHSQQKVDNEMLKSEINKLKISLLSSKQTAHELNITSTKLVEEYKLKEKTIKDSLLYILQLQDSAERTCLQSNACLESLVSIR